jgi:hypothetical protein
VRALSLEEPLLIPELSPAAPGAEVHRILYPATATPVTTGIHAETAWGFQRLVTGIILLVDIGAAPRAAGELIRHRPTTLVALRAGQPTHIAPALGPSAAGAEALVPPH